MKAKLRTLALAAAAAIAITGSKAVLADEEKVQLTFAVIQTEDMSVLASRWGEILKYPR